MKKSGVYLGIKNYGAEETCMENAGKFIYRFFVDGEETEFALCSGPDSCGRMYSVQNKLKEGSIYTLSVTDGTITDAEEISCTEEICDGEGRTGELQNLWKIECRAGGAVVSPAGDVPDDQALILTERGDGTADGYIAEPEYTLHQTVSGVPGERTLRNFLQTALMPVGTTLYVYGGGWNWQDDGSGPQTMSLGTAKEWYTFFRRHNAEYTYKDADGNEENRDRAHSYYPFGKYNEYYYAGLDCSGYAGWTLYNTMEDEDGKPGYVVSSSRMAGTLAEKGWGDLFVPAENSSPDGLSFQARPGDVVSISGHVWISLGTCEDGSIVIVHSTPSFSRTGQPGGGVQLGAVGNSEDCEAMQTARRFLSEYFAEWYARYDAALKAPAVYLDCSAGGHFRWYLDGRNGGLTDPDGFLNRSPSEILEKPLEKKE